MKPLRICEECRRPCHYGHVEIKSRIVCFDCAGKYRAYAVNPKDWKYIYGREE